MINLYVILVKNQRRTCNPENKTITQVPAKYRDGVVAILKEQGYDLDGYRLQVAKEEA